jgi:Sodium/hydrogen exchanger family
VHTVLGAFVAGVLIGESPILTRHIEEQLRGLIAALFMPVFFGLSGLSADLTILKDPELLLLAIGLIIIASAGKFAGAFVGGKLGRLTGRGAAYTLIVIYPRFCLLTNFCGGTAFTPFQHLNVLANPAYALDKPPLEILKVSVDEIRSSFLMTKDDASIHAGRDPVVRTSLQFDREMMQVFKSATCRGVAGEAPIEDALPVWRSLLKVCGRNDLVQKLSGYEGYRDLIQHGDDHGFIDARPTKAELIDLLKKKPEARVALAVDGGVRRRSRSRAHLDAAQQRR